MVGARSSRCFAEALRPHPALHLIAVIPHHPDQDGRFSMPPNLVGRQQAMRRAARRRRPDRVAVYGIENHAGTPVYVHAKVCVIDDVWASVGSDNINRRSWTHDSELSCAVVDDAARRARARRSSTGSATVPGASPATCGSNSPASTSTAADGDDDATSSTPSRAFAALRRERRRTAALARRRPQRPATARPAAARTAPSGCRGARWRGPPRCTGRSTTRTAGRSRCGTGTASDTSLRAGASASGGGAIVWQIGRHDRSHGRRRPAARRVAPGLAGRPGGLARGSPRTGRVPGRSGRAAPGDHGVPAAAGHRSPRPHVRRAHDRRGPPEPQLQQAAPHERRPVAAVDQCRSDDGAGVR